LSALVRRALAVAAGLVADELLGEPTFEPHPVAAFGRAMGRIEEAWYDDDRIAGIRYTVAGATIGLGAAATARALVGATASAALSTYVACAGRALRDAAAAVAAPLTAGDLDGARAELPALVGRDASALDDVEVARAVIESLAENTSDAVVATAVWALLAGARGALVHRALNTMDAMVGHRSPRYERFGWASARADDVANWLPARATAGLVVLVRPRSAAAVVRSIRRGAASHPSPNAGVAEAAFAGALGLRLGGTNRYEGREDVRPTLGEGRPPGAADVAAAARLARDVQRGAVGLLLLTATGIRLIRWRNRRAPSIR
jgi:adenosylcobinamide-phosphate synthase